jgi:hypothetical protein
MDDIDTTTFTDFLTFLFSKDKKLDLTWLISLELTYINKANYGVNSKIREISRIIYNQYDAADQTPQKKSLEQEETSLKTDLEFLKARRQLLESILTDDIKVKEEKIKIYIMQNPILNFFISNQNIGQYVDAALQQLPESIINIIADYARLIEHIPRDNPPEEQDISTGPKRRKTETSLSSFNRRKSNKASRRKSKKASRKKSKKGLRRKSKKASRRKSKKASRRKSKKASRRKSKRSR